MSGFIKTTLFYIVRTDFYDMRKGKKAISPENQQIIITVASSIGHNFPPDAWDKVEKGMEKIQGP